MFAFSTTSSHLVGFAGLPRHAPDTARRAATARTGLKHTSIAPKLKTYHEGRKQKRHEEQLGIRELRVLTVTTSRARVKTMVAAVQVLTGGAGSNVLQFAAVETFESGRYRMDERDWGAGATAGVSGSIFHVVFTNAAKNRRRKSSAEKPSDQIIALAA